MESWRDELYHHGIKGQKWGVRNGPPYPLDAEAKHKTYEQYKQNKKEHSKEENKQVRKETKQIIKDAIKAYEGKKDGLLWHLPLTGYNYRRNLAFGRDVYEANLAKGASEFLTLPYHAVAHAVSEMRGDSQSARLRSNFGGKMDIYRDIANEQYSKLDKAKK